MKKRMLAWVLVLAMLLPVLPAGVLADDAATSGTCGENLTWTLENGVLTISGTGEMEDYTAGSTPWNEIRQNIVSVVIASGVTSVGDRAFYECGSLTSVTIQSNIKTIGDSAFWSCGKLTTINFPESLKSIGDYAFIYCDSLTSIAFPDGVEVIGNSIFLCAHGLKSVSIGSSVASIGTDVFEGCDALQSIRVASNNTTYASVDGVLFNKVKTELICYPSGKLDTSYEIPAGVVQINDGAFMYCGNLENVSVPTGVKRIGSRSFYGCHDLTNVNVPSGVVSIGESAFGNCGSLTSITIPRGVTNIGNSAFHFCRQLTTVNIGYGIETIGIDTFFECNSLEHVSIPSSVKNIGGGAFAYCYNLKSINIPSGVTNIDGDAFNFCSSLTHVRIPANVASIGSHAFYACSKLTAFEVEKDCAAYTSIDGVLFNKSGSELICFPAEKATENYTIPSSVKYIDDQAFALCINLKNISIPDGVTEINDSTFYACRNMTSVSVPVSVTTIKQSAFSECNSLSDVYYGGTKTTWAGIAVATGNNALTAATIHYNASAGKCGDNLTWIFADGNLEIRGIGGMYDFSESNLPPWSSIASNVKNIFIWSDTASIGKNAFNSCSNATYVAISSSVTKIGEGAFKDCGNLRNAHFSGTEADWSKVQMGANNDPLTSLSVLCSGTEPGGSGSETGGGTGSGESGIPSGFNSTIYHAKWLSGDQSTEYILNEAQSPSRILSDALKGSSMETAVDLWKSFSLVFDTIDDISSLHDVAIEEKDMYSALILNALNASTSYDVIATEFEDALSLSKEIISDVKSFITANKGVDLSNDKLFLQYIEQNPDDIQDYISDWFKQEQPDLASMGTVFKNFSTVLKGVSNIENYCEMIAAYTTLSETSEAMKNVLRAAYNQSKSTYGSFDPLTLAFQECLTIITDSQQNLTQAIITKGFTVVGKGMAEYLVGEFWKEVSNKIYTVAPPVAVLQAGYKAGKTISNWLCNTDDTIEAYLKMHAILGIENIVGASYGNIKSAFVANQDLNAAADYIAAMSLMFCLKDVDCDSAYGYVDKLDSSLLNKVQQAFGKTDYNQLKTSIKAYQNDYKVYYITSLTGWINYLEEDYPGSGLYKMYEGLINQARNSVLKKEIIAACPVNVYVYDQSDHVVASVIDGRVSCSADNVMIALLGDQKVIRFYDGEDYRVEYVGYDTGNMDVTISEFDENESTVRTVNYYDVALNDGKTYTMDADNETLKPYELLDKEQSSVVAHDYDSMDTNATYNIEVISGTMLQNGEICVETTAQKGETLQLNAYVPEGYQFISWEASNHADIFADKTQATTNLIMPSGDITVTAILKEIEHSYQKDVVAPTCTEKGYTEYTCKYCGNSYVGDYVPATGHNWDGGKVTKQPTATEKGEKTYNCATCGETRTEEIPATSSPAVPDKPTGPDKPTTPDKPSTPDVPTVPTITFVDVPAGAYYYDAVNWAVSKGITNGTGVDEQGNNYFSPDASCTRAQAVTFLWRAAGSPEPSSTSNPFTDVPTGEYYYKAVLWAVEKGITKGVSDTEFSPNTTCNRAQIVTFLHRYEGEPKAEGQSFNDVPANEYYYAPVIWAVSKGVTNGTGGGKFSPLADCTRGQIVTFLYRDMVP